MAPKVKSNKSGKQNYPDKKDEYKEFSHAMACRILLQPLEKQHNLEIDITISYILRWQHMGYLALFNDLAKNPLNVAFLGPGQKYYKITP